MELSKNEIKLRLFESIAANSQNLTDKSKYRTPTQIAQCVEDVFELLFIEEIDISPA